MQHLNTLWQMVGAVSSVKDIAQQVKTYQFAVQGEVTFYLRTAQSTVQITRWSRPFIEVKTILQASFGWRIATDQDNAGVYIAAKRRSVVGGLSSATFQVYVPKNTHLMLKLEQCTLQLNNADGTIEIPALTSEKHIVLQTNPADQSG